MTMSLGVVWVADVDESLLELPPMSAAALALWSTIERLLREDGSRSDRSIAQSAGGCSHHTVAKVRRQWNVDAGELRRQLAARREPSRELGKIFDAAVKLPDDEALNEILLERATFERMRF